jgi:hypothetical protein
MMNIMFEVGGEKRRGSDCSLFHAFVAENEENQPV